MKRFLSQRRGRQSPQYTRGYPQAQTDLTQYVYGEGKNYSAAAGDVIADIRAKAYTNRPDGSIIGVFYWERTLQKQGASGAHRVANQAAIDQVTGKSGATIPLTHGG